MLIALVASTLAHPAATNPSLAESLVSSPAPIANAESVPADALIVSPPAPVLPVMDEAGDISVLALFVGAKQLDADDWEPVEDQIPFGLSYSTQAASAAVGFEVALFYSQDDDDLFISGIGNVAVEADFTEVSAGVHRSFTPESRIRPQIGAGLAVIAADASASTSGGSGSDDDVGVGLYVHGGLGFRLGSSLEIGADVRAVVGTEIDIAGADLNADYVQASLFLGWRL